MKEIVAKWNQDCFGGELSAACLDELDQIDDEHRELVGLVDTWLFYARLAGLRARDISPLGARFFARAAKSYLPSLWAKIPPITRGGRLQVIDRMVHGVLGVPPDRPTRFLDVGCGYPPLTTVDTAKACPAWTCLGIDPNFPVWLLFDGEESAACFDEAGQLVYIQYLQGDLQPELGRVQRDQRAYAAKWELIHGDPSLREECVRTGRLVSDPTGHYVRENLSFRATTLAGLSSDQPFDLIRCMNVFMYFSGPAMLEQIRHAKSLLADDAVFICGSSSESGLAVKYLVYQRRGDALWPYLFGLDLGKFSTREGNGWWGFHKDQPDTLFLASVVGAVTGKGDLWEHVSSVTDRLESELGYARRDPAGYLIQDRFLHVGADYSHLVAAISTECGLEITRRLGDVGLSAQITPHHHLVINLAESDSQKYAGYFPVL